MTLCTPPIDPETGKPMRFDLTVSFLPFINFLQSCGYKCGHEPDVPRSVYGDRYYEVEVDGKTTLLHEHICVSIPDDEEEKDEAWTGLADHELCPAYLPTNHETDIKVSLYYEHADRLIYNIDESRARLEKLLLVDIRDRMTARRKKGRPNPADDTPIQP